MSDDDRRVLAAVHDDLGLVLKSVTLIPPSTRGALVMIRDAIREHLEATNG